MSNLKEGRPKGQILQIVQILGDKVLAGIRGDINEGGLKGGTMKDGRLNSWLCCCL